MALALEAFLIWFVTATALAGDLNFSPDRPGVGDSTQTVGKGAFMGEVGLNIDQNDPFTAGTVAIARYGIVPDVELRLRVPDTQVAPEVNMGFFGVGWKWALALKNVEVSFVPELATTTKVMAFSLGGNAAVSSGELGAWVHASGAALTGDQGVSALVGGGVSQGIGLGGLYANAGYDGDVFVGPGAWIRPGDAIQVDVGVDVVLAKGGPVPRSTVGASVGF